MSKCKWIPKPDDFGLINWKTDCLYSHTFFFGFPKGFKFFPYCGGEIEEK